MYIEAAAGKAAGNAALCPHLAAYVTLFQNLLDGKTSAR